MASNRLILCHPFSCPQSFPTSGSFPVSQFFTSDGQIIGVSASASVLPTNIQDWFPLGLIGLISLGVDLQGTLKCLLKHHRSKASILLQFSYNWIADSIIRYTPIQNRKLKRKKLLLNCTVCPKQSINTQSFSKFQWHFSKKQTTLKSVWNHRKPQELTEPRGRVRGHCEPKVWSQLWNDFLFSSFLFSSVKHRWDHWL